MRNAIGFSVLKKAPAVEDLKPGSPKDIRSLLEMFDDSSDEAIEVHWLRVWANQGTCVHSLHRAIQQNSFQMRVFAKDTHVYLIKL